MLDLSLFSYTHHGGHEDNKHTAPTLLDAFKSNAHRTESKELMKAVPLIGGIYHYLGENQGWVQVYQGTWPCPPIEEAA